MRQSRLMPSRSLSPMPLNRTIRTHSTWILLQEPVSQSANRLQCRMLRSPFRVEVTNLSPGFIANTSVQGIQAQQSLQLQKSQKAAADLAVAKSRAPMMAVTQSLTAATQKKTDAALHPGYQSIYGFSVYNPGRGEAYIIELVNADQHIPDQLPQPTKYANYDPYYVRVVFLNTLTCYNMSIIVPTMVHDQYGHFSRQGTEYQNLFGQTDELELGYMYSLSNADNIFDNLNF